MPTNNRSASGQLHAAEVRQGPLEDAGWPIRFLRIFLRRGRAGAASALDCGLPRAQLLTVDFGRTPAALLSCMSSTPPRLNSRRQIRPRCADNAADCRRSTARPNRDNQPRNLHATLRRFSFEFPLRATIVNLMRFRHRHRHDFRGNHDCSLPDQGRGFSSTAQPRRRPFCRMCDCHEVVNSADDRRVRCIASMLVSHRCGGAIGWCIRTSPRAVKRPG